MGDLLSTENLLILAGISLVIPGLVTVLTKYQSSDGVKNLMHALVAALAGVGFDFTQAVLDDNRAFSLRSALVMALMAWGASTFTYVKLWKNSGVNDALADRTASFGVGAEREELFIPTDFLRSMDNNPPTP